MKLLIVLTAVVSVAAGAALMDVTRDAGSRGVSAAPTREYVASSDKASEGRSGSAIERLERSIKLKAGSKRSLGEVELSDGRRVRLSRADTVDSKSCLIEDDPDTGPGAGCLEGGLFDARKAAFSVNAQGGPDRFAELYVVGVAAPSVRSVAMIKTDGETVALDLEAGGVFLFESSRADLEAHVYPVGLRLLGANGKLVEVVNFPPAG
jgi:hypothetical protein